MHVKLLDKSDIRKLYWEYRLMCRALSNLPI